MGSSPHTRGAHRLGSPPSQNHRIIPAYAGSTSKSPPDGSARRDHPRIRGEHSDGVLTRMSVGGSSPHTRGARAACAWTTPPTWDHPRIRGEHPLERHAVAVDQGSSPHTRGARSRLRLRRRSGRIIPAYAGSTSTLKPGCCLYQDHPRIRGEHVADCAFAVALAGSSPHTRGAPRG